MSEAKIEMLCPDCEAEMKEYVMHYRCRKCRLKVEKYFKLGNEKATSVKFADVVKDLWNRIREDAERLLLYNDSSIDPRSKEGREKCEHLEGRLYFHIQKILKKRFDLKR